MSTYRTVSANDLRSIDNLKFTLKSYESCSSDPFFFINDNESVTSIVSEVDDDLYLGDDGAASNAPTLLEMQNTVPQLFKYRQSLDQYFLIEDFVANNLKNLSANFLNKEFLFSNALILIPITSEVFNRADESIQLEMVKKLTSIKNNFKEIKEIVQSLNQSLFDEYSKMTSNLKQNIFANFKTYKNFENSRAMFTGLQEVKAFLKKLVSDDIGSKLNGLSDNIIDLLYDYNQMGEDLFNSKKSSFSNTRGSASGSDNYFKLNKLIHYIESNLSESSQFIENDCTILANLIKELKLCFKEYVSNFETFEFYGLHQKFNYEIVSIDTHLKNQLCRTFSS